MKKFFADILVTISLWVVVFFKRLELLPATIGNWLGDHYQWFRRLEGGIWYEWNGFWQREDARGWIQFQRGLKGWNLMESNWVWDYNQILNKGDSIVGKIENYGAKEIKAQ